MLLFLKEEEESSLAGESCHVTESFRLLVPRQRGSPKMPVSQGNSWKVLRKIKLKVGGFGVLGGSGHPWLPIGSWMSTQDIRDPT